MHTQVFEVLTSSPVSVGTRPCRKTEIGKPVSEMSLRTVKPQFSSLLFSSSHFTAFALTVDNSDSVIRADNSTLSSKVSSIVNKLILTFSFQFRDPWLLFLGQVRTK